MQRHHWRALGAVSVGALSLTSLVLIARNRSSEAYAIALFLGFATTVSSAISELNAGAENHSPTELPLDPQEVMFL